MSECWKCKKNEETECMCVVDCDDKCGALNHPRTFEDYKKAYEHWADHSSLAGCSHGC